MDEKRLWLAVLIQAIKDLAGLTVVDNERGRARVQHFARLWFASDNHDPGSYLWICDELGLSPSWLRRRMITLASAQMMKAESGYQLRVSRAKSVEDGVLDDFDAALMADLLLA